LAAAAVLELVAAVAVAEVAALVLQLVQVEIAVLLVQVVMLATVEQLQFLGLIRVYKHGDENEYY
jgi:hypothetical protein